MKFGYFDDSAKEYVITRADTPRPWSNYLGSTEYGAIITNHAGGYSFYRSAFGSRFLRMRPNSVPLDQPGRYFYLRDNESKDYFSASWQPVGKPLDQYQSICQHGTAYTIISSEYWGFSLNPPILFPSIKPLSTGACESAITRNDADPFQYLRIVNLLPVGTCPPIYPICNIRSS